jgi:putative secretion ATPase (PEP-CTERM system associated)
MYIDHYGFHEHPFLMTPDARMFYASSVHSRAHAHLVYGLAQREGFVVITGEVGAGKTTLVERLCGELDPETYIIARIMTSQVSGEDLLRLVADAFGVPSDGTKAALLRDIIAALRAGDAAGRRHLLIVDEAQGLPPSALEELRMLSNVTENGRAFLQIILIGQPQLRRTIASPDLDQLRQRVLASFHLGALSREETAAYVEHRMRAVGWDGIPAWEPGALDLVYRYTGGIPRRINRLCARVLLGGALEQAGELTCTMVEGTARELEEDLSGGPDAVRMAGGQRRALLSDAVLPGSMGSGGTQGGMGVAWASSAQVQDLAQRVESLEVQSARRERVFNRLMDLFAGASGPRQ